MISTKHLTLSAITFIVLALCSCSKNNGAVDGDTDTGTGTDTGTDTGDIDTDYDGGPTTACEGDPPEGGMVCVPGGRYLMGCMPYDTQCEDTEKPMVEVTLSPFWIDKAEVTIENLIPFLNTLHEGYIKAAKAVLTEPEHDYVYQGYGAPVCLNEATDEFVYSAYECAGNPSCSRPITTPTGGLSWLGAKLLCEWRGMRLPTEAEWEAAARGQTKLIYPCAYEHQPCSYGLYHNCYYPDGNGPTASDVECPISAFTPPCCVPYDETTMDDCVSPIGADEMYGNAAEWVLDHKDDDHSWCAEGCTDPAPRQGELPVIKGGSIQLPAEYTRISSRLDGALGPANGVRCVSSPVQHVLPDGGVVWAE